MLNGFEVYNCVTRIFLLKIIGILNKIECKKYKKLCMYIEEVIDLMSQ